jgi:hypothetical protein
MKLPFLRFALAVFLTLFAVSAAVARPVPINTNCREALGNYTLGLTVPTGGFEFSLVRTTVKKDVLNIVVRYAGPTGPVTQAFETHYFRFTLKDSQRPKRYVVTANGRKLDKAKPIDRRVLLT